MNFKEKLARMLPKGPPGDSKHTPPLLVPTGRPYRDHKKILAQIQDRLRQIPPTDVPVPFSILEPWEVHTTPHGDTYEKVTRYPYNHTHGKIALNAALDTPTDLLAPLIGEPRLEGFRLEDALFLDIEATGLSHGAGTFAFMIGLGRFEKDRTFTVRQLVLKDPSHEMPFLLRFKEILDSAKYLISFNGKSYDLSILQTRLILHRLYSPEETELKLTPHLDLLHIHRALWKKTLPNCRLQTLEKELLYLERQDDVPGEMVPSLYFHYLQTDDARALVPILEHNEIDMVSMAALVADLLRSIHNPASIPDDNVIACLGELHLKRGNMHRSIQLLELGLRGNLRPEVLRTTFQSLIKAHKRLGRRTRLFPVLQSYADRFPDEIGAWTELAMHYEHRMKDYEFALECAEKCVSLLPRGPSPEREAVQKRVQRLERWRPNAENQ